MYVELEDSLDSLLTDASSSKILPLPESLLAELPDPEPDEKRLSPKSSDDPKSVVLNAIAVGPLKVVSSNAKITITLEMVLKVCFIM